MSKFQVFNLFLIASKNSPKDQKIGLSVLFCFNLVTALACTQALCSPVRIFRSGPTVIACFPCLLGAWARRGGSVQRPGTPPLPFSPVSFYNSSEAWSVFTPENIFVFSLSAVIPFRVSLTLKLNTECSFFSLKVC